MRPFITEAKRESGTFIKAAFIRENKLSAPRENRKIYLLLLVAGWGLENNILSSIHITHYNI